MLNDLDLERPAINEDEYNQFESVLKLAEKIINSGLVEVAEGAYNYFKNGNMGLDINANGMTTNIKNLFVAGEAVGGLHGKNRLMGNSLLDIIVFGRNAGINAAAAAKDATLGKLTLSHIESFEKEIADAGINTDTVSPKLLPDYTKKR